MPLGKKIRVLVIDDSLVFRETIARALSRDPAIEVVGTAEDPFAARNMIIQYHPDVLTLDVQMPKMNGIEFLKRLMPQYPLPVVVVSSVSRNVFDALNAGAIDFVTKPDASRLGGLEGFFQELIVKIKIASTANVGNNKSTSTEELSQTHQTASSGWDIIAIGASTGGTEAIYSILKNLPVQMPGIVVVQHMPPVFTRMYAERLNNDCKLEVKEAQNGDVLSPGKVLIAPGDYHMKVKRNKQQLYVECKKGERVSGHCPSVDVLFHSLADIYDISAVGIILTGMGYDGAKGLLAMKQKGHPTIGQNRESSIVYGMPKIAYEIGAVTRQLTLKAIPEAIVSTVYGKKN